MPRFNFNEIALSGKADVSKIQENFEEIEANGITEAEVIGKISGTRTFITAENEDFKVFCNIAKKGDVIIVNCKLIIKSGNKYASKSELLTLPEWAYPNNQYSDLHDSNYGLVLTDNYDFVHNANYRISINITNHRLIITYEPEFAQATQVSEYSTTLTTIYYV